MMIGTNLSYANRCTYILLQVLAFISIVEAFLVWPVVKTTTKPLFHDNWFCSSTCSPVLLRASVAPDEKETTDSLTIVPIKNLDGTVTLPGSKSLSNRCLLLAALSEGTTRVDNLLQSDDILYMLEALDKLGVPVERHSQDSVTVTGRGGPINSPTPEEVCDLFLGNAGTAMRPLTAAMCVGKGKYVLDGVPRMRERPIADLVDGLQQLGAEVECVAETGCPPVTITAKELKGGHASISGTST